MSKEDMQKYKEVYDNLKTPERWKTNVKTLMQEEMKKEASQPDDIQRMTEDDFTDNKESRVVDIHSKKKFSRRYKTMLSVSGIAAAILFVFMFNVTKSPQFVTPMKDGEVQAEVAMKDTTLYFEIQEDDKSSNTDVMAGKQENNSGFQIKVDNETGEVVVEDDAIPSYIRGTEVYLTITVTDEGYQYTAVYDKDGEHCEITRSGMTQKEFIQLLYKML